MDYKLVKGTQSNFEVQVTLTDKQMEELTNKTLKHFQKDIDAPGFRKGHVPINMVKDLIKPGYLEMGILEELVHKTLSKVLDENKDTQFIGQPYDFNPMQLKDAKDGKYTVTFKLDVYPEPEEKDKKWQKVKMTKLSVEVSDEKKNSVLWTIKKQYADYQDANEITEDSVSKVQVGYKDKDGNELKGRTVYVGEEEFEKDALSKKVFIGQKKGEVIEKKYTLKSLPEFIHYTGEEKPAVITFDIKDCKKVVLPEFTDKFIAEKFGDTGIKNEKDLIAQIEKTLSETHAQEELQKKVDDYLQEVEKSFEMLVPETFMQEEMKHRVKHMESQLGGEAGFKKFMESMGEEKAKVYLEEMRESARKSLSKFLLLKKIVDEQKLDTVDWNKQFDAEKKLYAKLTGDMLFNEEEKKPAKKATKKTTKAKK